MKGSVANSRTSRQNQDTQRPDQLTCTTAGLLWLLLPMHLSNLHHHAYQFQLSGRLGSRRIRAVTSQIKNNTPQHGR